MGLLNWFLLSYIFCFSESKTRCHSAKYHVHVWQIFHSLAAEIPDKYEGDSKDLTDVSKTQMYLTHLPQYCIYASVNGVCIGSGNGLSSVKSQAITWTNAKLLSMGPLGTNFSEILIKHKTFPSRNFLWKCLLRNGGQFVQREMR